MGGVFLARSGGGGLKPLQKHCVVKTLRPYLTDDREYVTRSLDEARVVVKLSHRDICQVFDVGLVGERYCLAMELIAGQDLRTLADATVPMPPALAIYIVGEVLEALDYAHRLSDVRGVPLRLVHRDVSPQHIMESYEGEVKLIDFGLAQSAVKGEKTSPQTVMTKLAYMSPEQLRGEPASPGIDLYAAAIVLCELLLGAQLFRGAERQSRSSPARSVALKTTPACRLYPRSSRIAAEARAPPRREPARAGRACPPARRWPPARRARAVGSRPGRRHCRRGSRSNQRSWSACRIACRSRKPSTSWRATRQRSKERSSRTIRAHPRYRTRSCSRMSVPTTSLTAPGL
jgi:serine/threonine protein kinase